MVLGILCTPVGLEATLAGFGYPVYHQLVYRRPYLILDILCTPVGLEARLADFRYLVNTSWSIGDHS